MYLHFLYKEHSSKCTLDTFFFFERGNFTGDSIFLNYYIGTASFQTEEVKWIWGFHPQAEASL